MRLLIAVLCVAMLAWTQFAVVTYACPMDAPEMTSIGMQSDCAGDMHQKPSMLCEAHCDHSSPSPQAPDVADQAALCMAATLAVPAPGSAKAFAHDQLVYPDSSPPLRIRYRVFRI